MCYLKTLPGYRSNYAPTKETKKIIAEEGIRGAFFNDNFSLVSSDISTICSNAAG